MIGSLVDITPGDAAVSSLSPWIGLYIENAGAVEIQYVDGSTDILENLATGVVHLIAFTRILAGSTVATGIKGGRLYGG